MSAPGTYDNSMPTTYQTGGVNPNPKEPYDLSFFKRPEGWVKIVEAVIGLIVFICATVDEAFVKDGSGAWVQFVSMTSFLITLIIMIFYVFYIFEKLPHNLPYLLVELIYAAVVTLLYFISGIVAAVKSDEWFVDRSAVEACAVFCFANMVAYGIDTFLLFMRWRASHGGSDPAAPSQTSGPATVTNTSTTTDMPPGVYPGTITTDRPEAGKPPY